MRNSKAKALRKAIYGKDIYTGPTGRVYAATQTKRYKTSGKTPVFFSTQTKTATGKRRMYLDAKKAVVLKLTACCTSAKKKTIKNLENFTLKVTTKTEKNRQKRLRKKLRSAF